MIVENNILLLYMGQVHDCTAGVLFIVLVTSLSHSSAFSEPFASSKKTLICTGQKYFMKRKTFALGVLSKG